MSVNQVCHLMFFCIYNNCVVCTHCKELAKEVMLPQVTRTVRVCVCVCVRMCVCVCVCEKFRVRVKQMLCSSAGFLLVGTLMPDCVGYVANGLGYLKV